MPLPAASIVPLFSGISAGLGLLLQLFGKEKELSPELQALIKREAARQRQTTPLLASVNRLAFDRLPSWARTGYEPIGVEQARQQAYSTIGAPSGNFQQPPEIREILREQLARSYLTDPVMQAVLRMAGQRLPRGYMIDITRKPPTTG